MDKEELKKTINLPKTDLPIKAGLTKLEPEIINNWNEINIYRLVQEKNKGKKKYILHDGPPYPNGDIHMGHALNKILKDIIVKYKSMQGFDVPFIPGWDCHGLPIETQLLKELKKSKLEDKKNDIPWFREKCEEYARNYVEKQKNQFISLGCRADWENPYLTLDRSYEKKIVEVFGMLSEKGYVYRGRKPIHWCATCETALAEAEIEYEDLKSPSIYIKFKVKKASPILKKYQDDKHINLDRASFIVWTTTPWTLPANVAVAVHQDHYYVLVNAGNQNETFILVEDLLEKVMKEIGYGENYNVIDKIEGKNLTDILLEHPFMERESRVVTAGYVTTEDGTGCVHIAPGHGQEDYLVGQEHNLPVIMPVDDKGKLTKEAGEFAGKFVFDADKEITEKMEKLGTLMKLSFVKHSYPHCWRCHNPVIFRATEQWFISMDTVLEHEKSLRDMSLKAIGETKWVPLWGEKRIRGMLENRPDWCISRQRSWGVPIPVFYCKDCGEILMKGIFNTAVQKLVEKEGTNGWFIKSAKEILGENAKCLKCKGTNIEKENNIMDVWLESGTSHAAVLETREDLTWPADLYLEGSDQHRGWFQSSLLVSLGMKNKAPYKSVLTHGFIVDDKGRKMSKSLGNVVDPLKVIEKNGADILRWWVALSDFKNDVGIAESLINQAVDSYSKVRNTLRFLLSNLYDFDPAKDKVRYEDMTEIDEWVLLKLERLKIRCIEAYEEFELHLISHGVLNFCAVDLSAYYLDMIKDRLYCDKKDGSERRSSQTALYEILMTILRIIAPILSFTAEDIYRYAPGKKEKSIQLEAIPDFEKSYIDKKLEEKWNDLIKLRERVYKKLEEARNNKLIKGTTEAKVVIKTKDNIHSADLPLIFIVSQVEIINKEKGEEEIIIAKADGEKCLRCWKYAGLHKDLCQRCSKVVYQ